MCWISQPADVTLEGCCQHEVFLVVLNVILGLFIRNALIPWTFLGRRFNISASGYWFKFAMDFVLIVLPCILSMTIYSDNLSLITFTLSGCLGTLLVFVLIEYHLTPDAIPPKQFLNRMIDEHFGPTTFVTYLRAALMILVVTAILGVDFPAIFPEKFAKTERYGHSLMDVGVALFVAAAAIGSRLKTSKMIEGKDEKKTSSRWWWLLSSYILLPVIGLARTIVIGLIGYQQHVSEYGVHWNFFYSMAVIRVVTKILPKKHSLITGTLFAIVHHCLLTVGGLEQWILFGENPRDNLVNANIEGLVSLMGYLVIHYWSWAIADYIANTGIRVRSWLDLCGRLFVLTFVFLMLQFASERLLSPPSRRVANITYCFSQMVVVAFACASFLSIQMFTISAHAANAPHFSRDENPFFSVEPCICNSINKNGLWFFLLANLFTGAINLSFDTKSADKWTSFLILLGYALLLCIVFNYSGYIRIKQKKN